MRYIIEIKKDGNGKESVAFSLFAFAVVMIVSYFIFNH